MMWHQGIWHLQTVLSQSLHQTCSVVRHHIGKALSKYWVWTLSFRIKDGCCHISPLSMVYGSFPSFLISIPMLTGAATLGYILVCSVPECYTIYQKCYAPERLLTTLDFLVDLSLQNQVLNILSFFLQFLSSIAFEGIC